MFIIANGVLLFDYLLFIVFIYIFNIYIFLNIIEYKMF